VTARFYTWETYPRWLLFFIHAFATVQTLDPPSLGNFGLAVTSFIVAKSSEGEESRPCNPCVMLIVRFWSATWLRIHARFSFTPRWSHTPAPIIF
jgi:hypothetical protein